MFTLCFETYDYHGKGAYDETMSIKHKLNICLQYDYLICLHYSIANMLNFLNYIYIYIEREREREREREFSN